LFWIFANEIPNNSPFGDRACGTRIMHRVRTGTFSTDQCDVAAARAAVTASSVHDVGTDGFWTADFATDNVAI
jgi:hypothetical protein